jgi:hypothetical protein
MIPPSVCDPVHYVSYGTPGGEYSRACRAAVVTEVTEHPDADATAGLAVLNPEGMFFKRGVPCDLGELLKPGESRRYLCGGRDYAGGTWHPRPARGPG